MTPTKTANAYGSIYHKLASLRDLHRKEFTEGAEGNQPAGYSNK